MGVGVSGWRLARAVSQAGQLGVVSGTGLDTVFVRRLQDGDPGGHLRRAAAQFPIPGVAADALARWFLPDGRGGAAYRALPMYRQGATRERELVTMLACFVEVWLAREGHDGVIGMNLLTKIQLPTLSSLYGAMLAGVDVVLMGAGIPREDPRGPGRPRGAPPGDPATGRGGGGSRSRRGHAPGPRRPSPGADVPLRRPLFLAIIASALARARARTQSQRPRGRVRHRGAHRRRSQRAATRRSGGSPSAATPSTASATSWTSRRSSSSGCRSGSRVATAARGVSRRHAPRAPRASRWAPRSPSAMSLASPPNCKSSVLDHAARGGVDVVTDAHASPTGFPFKVARWCGRSGERDGANARL